MSIESQFIGLAFDLTKKLVTELIEEETKGKRIQEEIDVELQTTYRKPSRRREVEVRYIYVDRYGNEYNENEYREMEDDYYADDFKDVEFEEVQPGIFRRIGPRKVRRQLPPSRKVRRYNP